MENQLQLAIAPDVAQGKYANLALIGHSQTEFVLDFASVMPAQKNATVVSRIVLAPEHAKRLAAALQDNIQKFEANFGTITIKNNVSTGNMPLSFGGGEA